MTTTTERNRVALENDGVRVDARDKVTGRAKYTRDQYFPNMIHAFPIRSPFANATIKKANLKAARKIKGVLDVAFYTDARKVTATDDLSKVRKGGYQGMVVGHVCAETRLQVDDGIAALRMEWEHGEPVTNLRREAGNTIPEPRRDRNKKLLAEIEKDIYPKAAHIIEETYETQVQHHVCLETHSAVADFRGDKAIIWGSTQGNYGYRDGAARSFGLDKKDVEVHCEFVGGGFGGKLRPGAEGTLAAQMSVKFKRPCKVENDRKAENTDTGIRPGSLQKFKIAVDAKGKIIGGRQHTYGAIGVRSGGGSTSIPGYDLGKFIRTHQDIKLSSTPAQPQRAPGWPQASFGMENILDQCAAAVGMDPIEFRKLNDPNEVRHDEYDIAAKEIGWDRRKPDGQWAGPIKHGFGIGGAEWHNARTFPATIEIRVYPDCSVEVRSGTQDPGTGTKTFLVDLAANRMGIKREVVAGLVGSTIYPNGPMSGGSWVSRSLSLPLMDAADRMKTQMLELAARETSNDAEELDIVDGAIVLKSDGSTKMSWEAVCKLIGSDHLTVTSQGDKKYFGEGESEGVVAAEVAVDVETGIVRVVKIVNVQACGVPVNRKTIESQIVGATIQGISFTLFENRILNRVNGAHVNPNMEWYKIAGPADIPEIVPIIHVPANATGIRAVGEPPIVAVPGAIGTAVANAIGARVKAMPITPDKVLTAIARAQA